MNKKFYKKSTIFAAILYVVVFIIFFGSLNFKHNLYMMAQVDNASKIVNATTVNQQQVQQQIRKIKAKHLAKQRAENARQKHLTKLAVQAKQQRIAEQQRLTKLRQQQQKLEQRQEQQVAMAIKKISQLQQRLTNLRKKHNLAEKTDVEKQLQAQIAAEQQQIFSAQNKQMQSEIDKYKVLITSVIEQNWIVPPKVDKKLSAQLLINLASGGTVLGVKILQSSGDAVLDRSVITAVWKASPLPVPNDTKIFAQMRELHLTVKPEGILS